MIGGTRAPEPKGKWAILRADSVEDVVPTAPEWLRGFALEKWQALWPVLDHEMIKPELHSDLVAMYCQAFSDFREACNYIGVKGVIVKDDEGRVLTNPYVAVRDAAVKQMTITGKALGLSPDSFQVPWDDYAPTARTFTHDGEGTGAELPTDGGQSASGGDLPTVAE
jgi:P27 family predicted phage terminase small subunit